VDVGKVGSGNVISRHKIARLHRKITPQPAPVSDSTSLHQDLVTFSRTTGDPRMNHLRKLKPFLSSALILALALA